MNLIIRLYVMLRLNVSEAVTPFPMRVHSVVFNYTKENFNFHLTFLIIFQLHLTLYSTRS